MKLTKKVEITNFNIEFESVEEVKTFQYLLYEVRDRAMINGWGLFKKEDAKSKMLNELMKCTHKML